MSIIPMIKSTIPTKDFKWSTLSKHKIAIQIRNNPLPTKDFSKENKLITNWIPNSLRIIIAANILYVFIYKDKLTSYILTEHFV